VAGLGAAQGQKIRQRVQLRGVVSRAGNLKWQLSARVWQGHLRPVQEACERAGAGKGLQRGQLLRELPKVHIVLPPDSP